MNDTGVTREERASTDVDVPDQLAGATVLVTGGAGFVGSHIVRSLSEACEVVVLDDLSVGDPSVVPPSVEFVRGDVRETDIVEPLVAEADVVFHQAGLVSVGESIRRPVDTHARNATGTVTVLEAARRSDARVVYASSAAVYGSPDSLPIHESDGKTPTSPYGISKLTGDQYARAYDEQYDVEAVALRYFNVYGPDRDPDSSSVIRTFLERAREGRPLVIEGDGAQTRDFVHVSDVVRANLAAAVTDATGRAYNVGTGAGISIRELAERIVALSGADVAIRHDDPRPGDIDHSRAAVERAAERLGFRAHTSIEEGLATLVEPRQRAD